MSEELGWFSVCLVSLHCHCYLVKMFTAWMQAPCTIMHLHNYDYEAGTYRTKRKGGGLGKSYEDLFIWNEI